MNGSFENTTMFGSILYMLHAYASLIVGWITFHRCFLAEAVADKLIEEANFHQIATYLIFVAAFFCLTYVATLPIARLVVEVFRLVERGISAIFRP